MDWDYSTLLNLFKKDEAWRLLLDGRWGLEKESLRITPTGGLAQTPHPAVFGNKLKNPNITVDFFGGNIRSVEKNVFFFLKKINNLIKYIFNDTAR